MNPKALTALAALAAELGVADHIDLPGAPAREFKDKIVNYELALEVRNINVEKRTADFVFSSEAVDSYGEIVRQNWDLSRFKRNPVILYNHRSSSWGDPLSSLPIGKCIHIELSNGKLQGTVKFATKEFNEFAETVWIGVQEGMIRATSVGFFPHTVKYERVDDVDQLILDDNELFEISIVPIGANPDAVALAAGNSAQRERLHRRAAPHASKDEINMTAEELAKKEAEITTANERAKAAESELAKLRATAAEQKAALDKAAEEKLEIQAKALSQEAQGLVGKKIAPTQVEDYIMLSCGEQGERFRSFVTALPDMPHTEVKTPKEPVASGESTLAQRALKAAREATAPKS